MILELPLLVKTIYNLFTLQGGGIVLSISMECIQSLVRQPKDSIFSKKIRQGDKMLKVEALEVNPKIEVHELQKLKSWR